MHDDKKRVYSFWNGKNIDGKEMFYDLIEEENRTGQTESKYDVSNETLSADEL